MYEEINEISGKRKSCPQSGCMKAKDGRMLIDRTDVLNRWAEYIEELFEEDREEEKPEIQKPMEGPPILKDEVRDALKKMNSGEARMKKLVLPFWNERKTHKRESQKFS